MFVMSVPPEHQAWFDVLVTVEPQRNHSYEWLESSIKCLVENGLECLVDLEGIKFERLKEFKHLPLGVRAFLVRAVRHASALRSASGAFMPLP